MDLPDEIGLSIVVADGKGDIPKFQKVLNAFGFDYGVLVELDGKPVTGGQTAPVLNIRSRSWQMPERTVAGPVGRGFSLKGGLG